MSATQLLLGKEMRCPICGTTTTVVYEAEKASIHHHTLSAGRVRRNGNYVILENEIPVDSAAFLWIEAACPMSGAEVVTSTKADR